MDAKEYLRAHAVCVLDENPSRSGHILDKRVLEGIHKAYKRQQKLRKIKNWIVIFIVAAVFLLFSYGVFGFIVDVLPQIVK
jgi:hypothetical protein